MMVSNRDFLFAYFDREILTKNDRNHISELLGFDFDAAQSVSIGDAFGQSTVIGYR